MRFHSLFSAVLVSASLALAACSPDPASVKDQSSILKKSKSDTQKVKAVDNLKAIGSDEAKAAMISALQGPPKPSGKVVAALARALGEAKAADAVPALVDALDMAAGAGGDQATVDANAANKEIARALADIGDAKGADAMARLLRVSRDNYVRIEAINALARFKDPSTAETLIDTVNDDRQESFINKKALIALSELKDERALDTFIWMLFYERKGTSFFPESSMGVFKLGDKAVKPLVAILEGSNADLLARAKEEKMNPAAMMAKAAQVLGDLSAREAVPALIKLLKYTNEDDPRAQFFVRMAAADALGRIRAKAAIKPLQSMLGEEETTARQTYIRALFMIGDTSSIKKLDACATKEHWLLRDVCMYGLAMVAPRKDAKLFAAYEKNVGKLFAKDCEEYGIFGDIDCATEGKKDLETMKKAMAGYRNAVSTACASGDMDCLKQNLESDEPRVRERAAYELGRKGGTEVVPLLLNAIHREMKADTDVPPRFAAVLGLDWATRDDGEARALARKDVPNLQAQVDREKTKKLSQASAEDVSRLIMKLERE